MTWQPISPPEFAVHNSKAGVDCGWGRDPNPHVGSEAHYQECVDEGSYRDEPVSFEGETGPELVCEIIERPRGRRTRR